eukprot:12912332-Prorocentrum_lima.AAC.1
MVTGLSLAHGGPGIQAGNQQQQQQVEVPTPGNPDPCAHGQGRHEHQPGESIQAPQGMYPQAPNQLTGVIANISERRGRFAPEENSNI